MPVSAYYKFTVHTQYCTVHFQTSLKSVLEDVLNNRNLFLNIENSALPKSNFFQEIVLSYFGAKKSVTTVH